MCGQYYYTGHTDNIEHRIAQHKNRTFANCYTATKLPVNLLYSQSFVSREETLAAERQIKGWSRKKKEALIANNWVALSNYAKRKNK